MPALKIRLTKPGKLPYIKLWHNKTLYCFVIDTGSTLSWTTPGTMGMLLLGKECSSKDDGVSVTLRTEPLGFTDDDNTATKFNVRLHCGEGSDKIHEMNRHVEEPVHGILGIDFLSRNCVKIDLDNDLLHL